METACCSRAIKKVKRHHSCSPSDEVLVISDDRELTSEEITCESRCRQAQPQPSQEISEVFHELLALHQEMKEMADLSCYISSHDQEKNIRKRAKVEPHNRRITRSSSTIVLDVEDTSSQESLPHSSGVSTQTLQGRVTIKDLLLKQDLLFKRIRECLDSEFCVRSENEDLKQDLIEWKEKMEKEKNEIVDTKKIINRWPFMFEIEPLRKVRVESYLVGEESKKLEAMDHRSSFVRALRVAASNKCLNVLDAEMACDICSEWFIEATTTQCAHTFCKKCLETWRRLRSKSCPLCRAEITFSVPSPVVDNTITRMVENLIRVHRLKRMDAIKERCETSRM